MAVRVDVQSKEETASIESQTSPIAILMQLVPPIALKWQLGKFAIIIATKFTMKHKQNLYLVQDYTYISQGIRLHKGHTHSHWQYIII